MPQTQPGALRDVDPEQLLDFLLRFATMQTSVGVQTSRIVVNTTRIAHAYGYELTSMLSSAVCRGIPMITIRA